MRGDPGGWSGAAGLRRVLPLTVACLATLALAVRLFAFIDRHAVDLLFSDQWDFLNPLFSGGGWWDDWRYQHGPHRQGLGGLVLAVLMPLSRWDARAIAVASGVIAVLAAVAALALARALRGRWSAWDATLPLIVLTVSQCEFLVVTPNPAIGPATVLFVLLFAGCLLVPGPRLRLALLVLVSFVMEQTGYTIVFAAIALPMLALLLARAVRERTGVAAHALALGASAASVLFFAWGYTPMAGGECRQLGTEPARYLRFVELMFLRPFELPRDSTATALLPVGALLAAGCAALAAWSGWRTVRTLGTDRLGSVVFCLTGFASLSAALAALGRACGGLDAGTRSAYVTYLLPFLVAVYLIVSLGVRGRARHALLAVLFLVLLDKETAGTRENSVKVAEHYARGKERWRECYLRTADPVRCNQDFELYPNPATTHMAEKMDFLRARRAGPFRDAR